MGFSVNDALTYKGILTAELEASSTLPNGIYRQNENPMLSSDGVTNLYRGMLISIRGTADGSGNYYGTQFYLTGDGTVKYQRAIEFGYVRPWQRIDNFGYNSLG